VSHTFELELEIVTPGRLLVRSSAKEVQIPGKSGYLGILPGHAPLITELGIGETPIGRTESRTLLRLRGVLPKCCLTV
jgi:F0F1-type ATP synthase epsilon subunit